MVFHDTQLGVGKDGEVLLPGSLRTVVDGEEKMGKSWECIVEDSNIDSFFGRVWCRRRDYLQIERDLKMCEGRGPQPDCSHGLSKVW